MVVLWLFSSFMSFSKQYVAVLWLGLQLLSSVSNHNTWACYGLVCCFCRQSISTIYVVVLWLELSLLSVSKYKMWSYYGWFCHCFRQSVNTKSGRNIVEFVIVLSK